MDPEQLQEFEENIRMINELLAQQANTQAAVLNQMKQQLESMRQETSAIKNNTEATKSQAKETEKLTAIQKAEQKQKEESDKALAILKTAASNAGSALGGLVVSILSTERTFGKYNDALGSAGDAALNFGKAFGPLGQAAGIFTKGVTMAGQAALKQTDNVIVATDQIAKIGGAGSVTTQQFLDLAHQAGVTSKNLEILVKPLQSLGPGLASLGASVGEGVKVFGQLTENQEEDRVRFRRLGVSQEELIQNQADYIALQRASGQQITEQMKRDGSLRKASLDYTNNLLELSALTGKNVDQIKKEQEAALMREETMIQTNMMERKIASLREQGATEEANKLEAELEARNKLLQGITSQVGDQKLSDAVAKYLATGAITEESAFLARLGIPLQEFSAKIKAGEDVLPEFLNRLKSAGDAQLDNIGTAAMFDKEVREAFGYSQELLQYLSQRRGVDEADARTEVQRQQRLAQQGGRDRALDARAALTEVEIAAGVELDKFVNKINPLMNGFDGLTAAAAAAALALASIAGTGLLGRVGRGLLGRVGRGAGSRAGRQSTMTRTPARLRDPATSVSASQANASQMTRASRFAKGAGAGAAVIGAGMSIYGGYQTAQDINQREQTGELTEVQAARERRRNVGGTTGEVGGAAAGAIAGAKLGAAAGAALGPIGLAVGGLIGAGLGAWAGAEGGRKLGETLGDAIGEEINVDKIKDNIEDLNIELEIAREEGKSDREIKLIETKIELNKQLEEAVLAGDNNHIRLLQTELELTEALIKEDEKEIQRLSRLAELDAARLQSSDKLRDAKVLLNKLKDEDASEEQIARVENLVQKREKELALVGEKRDIHQELIDAQRQLDAEQSAEVKDVEKIKLLEDQVKLRNGILIAMQSEGEENAARLAELQSQRESELETTRRRIDLEREIAQLEESKKERWFDWGREKDQELIEQKQRELAQLSGTQLTSQVTSQEPQAKVGAESFKFTGTGDLQETLTRQRILEIQKQLEAEQSLEEKDNTKIKHLEDELKLRNDILVALESENENSKRRVELEREIAQLEESKKERWFDWGKEKDQKLIEQKQQELAQLSGTPLTSQGTKTDQGGTATRTGTTQTSKETMNAKVRELEWSKADPESYQEFAKFREDRANEIFKTLQEENNQHQSVRREQVNQDRANDQATIEGIKNFAKEIEAAGAGYVNTEMPKASKGGLFSGPNTGYPVELHGTELVAPINPNSILMELANTTVNKSESVTSSVNNTVTGSNSKSTDLLEQSITMNSQLMEVLVSKLDTMINALETGNDNTDKLLKHSI